MTCPNCGIGYALPEWYIQVRQDSGGSWYCPNGHPLSFTKLTIDQLREELDQKARLLGQAENRERAIAQQLATEQRAKKRLAKRLESGVCPVAGCKRHFTNLQRHIETEHKSIAIPPSEYEPKQLAAGKEKVQ